MLRKVARFIARKIVPTAVVDGVDVFFVDPDVARPEIVSRLEAALAHLKRFDNRRYRLVRRQVRHVMVWPGHYNAYTKLGGILLASELAQDAEIAETVGTLVHEAVHLRIRRFGVRHGRDRDARIERRCVTEQVDSLLVAGLIEAPTAAKIFEVLATEWWTEEAHRKNLDELMRKAGLPAWSGRLFEPVRLLRPGDTP